MLVPMALIPARTVLQVGLPLVLLGSMRISYSVHDQERFGGAKYKTGHQQSAQSPPKVFTQDPPC
jgi:hypothetical protein